MSVPTVNVTCTVNDSEGNPVEGARVSAKLSTAEKYHGFVAPLTTNAVSDATGVAVLALFPNELGSESSEYAFKIMDPSTGKSIKFPAVIPNMDCNLFEIANVPPYPREYVGETFSKPVFDARDEVLAATIDAESAKTAAAQSEANTLASEQNASQFAADAQQSKSDALGSATSASTSAGQAETAKVAAESARDGAVVAKGGAEAARDEAVSAKNAVPGLIDTEKAAAVGEVNIAKDSAVGAVQGVYQSDLDLLKSKQAREIGGTAYQSILGFLCPPSLEVKAWDARNNVNGVPDGFTFARASSATQINAAGQIKTVGNDVLRHDYDPETGEYKGFLIEEQRTNSLLQSEDFSYWSSVRGRVISDQVDAPDGGSADLWTESIEAGDSYLYQTQTIGIGDYRFSVFCREFSEGTQSKILIKLDASYGFSPTDDAGYPYLIFDLKNKSVLNGSQYEVEELADGWIRLSVFGSNVTGYSGNTVFMVNGSSNVESSGLYIWGAQLEKGSFPTSYIPTTTAAATRAADNLSIATADFPYNQNEGTIFFMGDLNNRGVFCELSDGTSSNRIFIFKESATTLRTIIGSSGTVFYPYVTIPAGTIEAAMAYAADDFSLVANGGTPIIDNEGAAPSGITELVIGSRNDTYVGYANGHIRHFAYFPRRISNEQLQALTR